jgi:hypothetical protein
LLTAGPGVGTRSRSVADVAALTALGLTTAPATVGAQPITILRGDVRSSADRSSWQISWRSHHPLLARALDHLGPSAWQRTTTRLLDLPPVTHGWVGPEGERRPYGPLRYGPPGRVLSVR